MWKRRAVSLLSALMLTEKKMPAVIDYVPSKLTVPEPDVPHYKLSPPRGKGFPAKRLTRLIKALEQEKRANLHNIMVIKDGELIMSASHPGYSPYIPHLSHSMSKTVTSLAVGFLVSEGKLDTCALVADFFPEFKYEDKRFAKMTVEHLLTMRSGVPFSEMGTVTESEWTKTFFSSLLTFAPGEKFAYNSMNSYILGRIVQRISGMTLTEFLTPRLLAPLGIKSFLWEMGPEGVEKGGFGIYMSCESWAKIGELYLGEGYFRGRRIISREWILRSLIAHSEAPEELGDFNYGYHIWVARTSDECLLNGMLGQNVWVCPKNNIIVAINSGNSELFQQSPALDIVRRELGGDLSGDEPTTFSDILEYKKALSTFFEKRHWLRPAKKKSGILELLGLKSREPFDERWTPILGTYLVRDNNCGILPLFVRLMQSNYQGGIDSVTISRDENSLIFTSREGGKDYTLDVGLYDFKESILDFCGEKYLIRAMGEATEDEDRNTVYKLELIFPELPNSRTLKLSLFNGIMTVEMNETPNEQIASSYLQGFLENRAVGFLVGIVEKRTEDGFLESYLKRLFRPTLTAVSTKLENANELLERENTEYKKTLDSAKFLTGILARFSAKEETPAAEKQDGAIKKFFSGIFSKIKRSDTDKADIAQDAEGENLQSDTENGLS